MIEDLDTELESVIRFIRELKSNEFNEPAKRGAALDLLLRKIKVIMDADAKLRRAIIKIGYEFNSARKEINTAMAEFEEL